VNRSGAALGNRLTTGILVLTVLAGFGALWPDPDGRAAAEYVSVVTLGYAHLVGAALANRAGGRARSGRTAHGLWRIGWVASAATGVAACFGVIDVFPVGDLLAVTSPLLALSVWHTVENDLAIAGAYGRGFALGPIPRASHFPTLAGVALVGMAVVVLARVGVTFADVFAASTLYHLVQWLVFLRDRASAAGEPARRRALLRAIGLSHVPAAVLCAILLGARSRLPPLAFEIAFSPCLYLVWSALHVVQTALVRAGAGAPASQGLPA